METMTETLERAFERSKAGNGVLRRCATFRVSFEDCAPGAFTEDFELTIGSLTSALEYRATQACKGDQAALPFQMARLSVMAFNGATVDPSSSKGEWLWEALGQAGRMIVVSVFGQVCVPQDGAMGKALSSLRIG